MRLQLVTTAVAAISLLGMQAWAQQGENVVLYYSFDNPTDPVIDSSGNGNHGVMMNMTVDDYTEPGQGVCGRAIDFGDYDSANYIEILSDSAFTSLTTNDAYTVAWWQRLPVGDVANQTNFRASGPDMDRVIGTHAPWSNGQIYHDVNYNDTSIRTRVNEPMPGDPITGVWTHIALTKAQGDVGIWVNGELLDSNDGTAVPLLDINAWRIGAQADGANDTAGLMDDFTIWNAPLTGFEIAQIVHTGGPGMHGGGPSRTDCSYPAGDLDLDGFVDERDANLLTAGIADGTNDPHLDLDGDGLVTAVDLDYWFPLYSFFSGVALEVAVVDVNFDTVNTLADFQTIASNLSVATTNLTDGNLHPDGVVDVMDLDLYVSRGGVIPEPSTFVCGFISSIVACGVLAMRRLG